MSTWRAHSGHRIAALAHLPGARTRQPIRLLLLGLGLLLTACLPATPAANPGPPGAAPPTATYLGVVGSSAPAFQVRDLDDQVVDLAGLRGQPVWLNFWATWCPPCKAEMPLMEQQYQQHQAAGLVILGVNIQESPAVIRAWTQQRFHWRFVPDPQGTLATLYRIEGLPSHVFIDRSGVVRSIHIGELRAADMATNLAEILPP